METWSLDELLKQTLPLNRKERYFTGTVLPALIGGDLEHLGRFAALVGVDNVRVSTARDDCTVLLFSEYGISESVVGAGGARFAGLSTARDTPDLVVLITEPVPVLIAVEAKMYDRPSRQDLIGQLERQAEILLPLTARLADWLNAPAVRLVRVALLPEKLRAGLEAADALPVAVVTWEQVRDAWHDVGGYYHRILAVALDGYDDLVSRRVGYQDGELAGQDILDAAKSGSLAYAWMGRAGGLGGHALAADVATGAWRTTRYQVRKAELPGNPNWFGVASFVTTIVDPPIS